MNASLAVPAWVAMAVLVCVAPASAQTAPEVHGSPQPAANADLLIDADISIRSIRFDTVAKDAHLNVTGVNQLGGYRVIRTNLPAHPQAGKTYKNVRIQLQATSRFVAPTTDSHAAPQPSPSPR